MAHIPQGNEPAPKGTLVTSFIDPLTRTEPEGDYKIVGHECYVGTVEGDDVHNYRVRIPGVGIVGRNIRHQAAE